MTLLGEVTFNFSNITSDNTTLALVGYIIVFLALSLLYFIFNNLPKVLDFFKRRHLKKKGVDEEIIDDLTITGEVSAAISTSLFLFFNEMHDEEKAVLTIKKISKQYSPWNSKIYNVTKGLNRRF